MTIPGFNSALPSELPRQRGTYIMLNENNIIMILEPFLV